MVNNSSICHYEECNDEVIQTNISGLPRKIFDFSRNDRKAGFTLAETLIVVAVLGVIAMLTIPNLIKNQIEAQHRTKVKKSMTVYDLALSKIVLDNDIKNNSMLAQYAEEQKEANCEDSSKYFKKSKETSNGCIFMTSDKVWYNIEDIRRPVISFEEITPENKDEITANANTRANKKAFVLVGHFDDRTGALRVNDLNFEKNNAETIDANSSYDQVSKLFDFINNKKDDEGGGTDTIKPLLSMRCTTDSFGYNYCEKYEYDGNGNQTASYSGCDGSGNNCSSSQKYEYDGNGNQTAEYYCNGSGNNCSYSQKYEYDGNGNQTAYYYNCDGSGNNCSYSQKYEYDGNGNQTAYYYCDGNGNNCDWYETYENTYIDR